ncbi:uncharacterized protein [Dermacentor andersoni]|uniref:uncharacterized protein isoform X2 n=1 Tax=Dermacentor andersoni TaxID=34620 RepID=UPI003B3A9B19
MKVAPKSAIMSYTVAILISVSLLQESSQSQYGETRIDFDENYYTYQNITKVFKDNQSLWLYGTNYQHVAEGGANCIYFQATSFHSGGLNFTYNKRVNGTWKHVPHTATYIKEKDLYYGPHKDRTAPNSISVLKSPGNPDIRIYRLIYEGGISGCFVFRVPGQHDGKGCMVLLNNETVSKGTDEACQRMYNNSCGVIPPYIQVFNASCLSGNLLV